MDKLKELSKILATKRISECEQYLSKYNIDIRNEDWSYRALYDVLKECAEVWNKEINND